VKIQNPPPKEKEEKKGAKEKAPSTSKKEKTSCATIRRKDGSWDQNKILQEACNISEGDLDFVKTLLAENGRVDPFLVSKPNSDGTTDHGLCQFNSYWHGDFIKSKSFQYWDLQLKRCWDIYSNNPNRFAAYKVREKGGELLVFLN